MNIAAIVLAVLSTASFSSISALPMSATEAPEYDCTQSTRTLHEGLEILREAAVPRNIIPRVFRRDLFNFKSKVTALEFICQTLDESQGEHLDNYITSQISSADVLRQQTCSWLNSLGETIFPNCAPTEVEFFCRRVQISNLSYRLSKHLGSLTNPDPIGWISVLFADEQEIISSDIREYICSLFNNRPCSL